MFHCVISGLISRFPHQVMSSPQFPHCLIKGFQFPHCVIKGQRAAIFHCAIKGPHFPHHFIKMITSNFQSRYQRVPIHHCVIKGLPLIVTYNFPSRYQGVPFIIASSGGFRGPLFPPSCHQRDPNSSNTPWDTKWRQGRLQHFSPNWSYYLSERVICQLDFQALKFHTHVVLELMFKNRVSSVATCPISRVSCNTTRGQLQHNVPEYWEQRGQL